MCGLTDLDQGVPDKTDLYGAGEKVTLRNWDKAREAETAGKYPFLSRRNGLSGRSCRQLNHSSVSRSGRRREREGAASSLAWPLLFQHGKGYFLRLSVVLFELVAHVLRPSVPWTHPIQSELKNWPIRNNSKGFFY